MKKHLTKKHDPHIKIMLQLVSKVIKTGAVTANDIILKENRKAMLNPKNMTNNKTFCQKNQAIF